MEGFYGNPYFPLRSIPQSKYLDRKPSLLKSVMKMLKCSFPQLMASGRGVGGERLSFLSGAAY